MGCACTCMHVGMHTYFLGAPDFFAALLGLCVHQVHIMHAFHTCMRAFRTCMRAFHRCMQAHTVCACMKESIAVEIMPRKKTPVMHERKHCRRYDAFAVALDNGFTMRGWSEQASNENNATVLVIVVVVVIIAIIIIFFIIVIAIVIAIVIVIYVTHLLPTPHDLRPTTYYLRPRLRHSIIHRRHCVSII